MAFCITFKRAVVIREALTGGNVSIPRCLSTRTGGGTAEQKRPLPPASSSSLAADNAKASGRSSRVWFQKGLSFACTSCGKCCTGVKGQSKVWVNAVEAQELAERLDLSMDQLRHMYLDDADAISTHNSLNKKLIKQKWSLRMTPATANKADSASNTTKCIFLKDNNQCQVYDARPVQCRTFPWWPQNLASHHDWKVVSTHCEGIVPEWTDMSSVGEKSNIVPFDTILQNLVVHSVNRAHLESLEEEDLRDDDDDATSLSYDIMMDSLKELEPALLEEFEQDFIETHETSRSVVYEDEDIVIHDNNNHRLKLGSAQRRPTRSLYFQNSLTHVQSEIPLLGCSADQEQQVTTRTSFDKPPVCFDYDTLILEVHQTMALCLDWIPRRPSRIALLGTGAGALPMYLHRKFPEANIDCVEASAKVLHLAQEYFGLVGGAVESTLASSSWNDKTNSHQLRHWTMLGEDFIFSPSSSTAVPPLELDLLMIDVADSTPESHNPESIRSRSVTRVPPPSMLTKDFLGQVRWQLKQPSGMLVMNVIAANPKELNNVLQKIGCDFDYVHHIELLSNTVVFASNSPILK